MSSLFLPFLLRSATQCAVNYRLRLPSTVPFPSSFRGPFVAPFSTSPQTMENPHTQSRLVQHRGADYRVVKEGRAHILNPPSQEAASKGTKKDLTGDDEVQSVFYNPIQQFNRDLSALAIRAYGEHSLELKKRKAERRLKKQTGNGPAKGTKRKREDTEDQTTKPDATIESEKRPEASVHQSEQPPEAQSNASTASFTILDALSATGLRALRYASEIPFVTKVVANDLSDSAIQSMKVNIEYNELQNRIQPNLGDARVYMYGLTQNDKFDVIDLDPYGTAAPFMDAAVQAIKDGGLLCVTCTDAGVWASTNYSEKAFALYGGIPTKGSHSHEGGLRLILNALAISAAKYGMAIEPLLSLSIDFYARVFVRVHRSPAQVKFNAGNTMLVYNCDSGCGAWSTQPLASTKSRQDRKGNPIHQHGVFQGPTVGPNCEHCGSKTHLGGPMWGGPLHNSHFIQRILDTLPAVDDDTYGTVARIEGMLTTALEEDLALGSPKSSSSQQNKADAMERNLSIQIEHPAIIPRMDPAIREQHPFYFTLSTLAKVLHTSTVPFDEFRGALHHLGYRSARSHAKPNSLRTDAPWDVLWEIMREWARQRSPIKETSLKPGSPGATIMGKSRENLRKPPEEDQWLSRLKEDLLAAVEAGRDASDLITKVEAALYRSGSRQTWQNTGATAESRPGPGPQLSAPATSSERPHPSTLQVIFDGALGRGISDAHTNKRLVRYQINPRANWGPLNRASK